MSGSVVEQATEFASDLSQALTSFLGRSVEFRARQLEPSTSGQSESRIIVGLPDLAAFEVAGRPLLSLEARFHCRLDHVQEFMVVDKSWIKVHAGSKPSGEPLFRYEYEREARNKPVSHLQIHGHSDRFSTLMALAKASKRPNSSDPFEVSRMDKLHFPLGGHRFRPALEDVLQMIEIEFKVKPGKDWPEVRDRLRTKYRRAQTAAAVRDCPSQALQTLRQLGYDVPEPEPHAGNLDRVDRLRAF